MTRTINAPVDRVFRTVSDIRQLPQAVPDIIEVEFPVGEPVGRDGMGFAVHRDGDSERHGAGAGDGRPARGLRARITTPLMKGVIRKALEKDMDAVKAFCEAGSAEGGGIDRDS